MYPAGELGRGASDQSGDGGDDGADILRQVSLPQEAVGVSLSGEKSPWRRRIRISE